MLRLAISIKAPKMAEEEQFLKELQDRNSPNFHKYLTPQQWNARFAPSAQDEQAVVDWVKSHGLTVTARYPNRLMVDAEGTVDAIQRAFNIHINKYEVNGTVEFSNDVDPQIPSTLEGIIQYVDGLNSILRMRPANSQLKGVRGPDYSPGPVRQEGLSGHQDANSDAVKALKSAKASNSSKLGGSLMTNGFYDPADIWSPDMYDFDALQAQGHCCNPTHNSGGTPPQTSIAVVTDADFLDSDIVGFHNQYPYLAGHWFRHWIDGTPSCCGDESTLDTEWSMATSNSQGSYLDTASIHNYETATGFGAFGDSFNQIVTDNVVKVVNISYGLNEDYLNGLGLVSAWHSIFNQMLGQGMTIMAASGDSGATAGCGSSLAVLYPESDPDVVSVGGTQLLLNGDGSFNSEVTWTGDTYSGACSVNDGGTGGGCSNLFAAPGYQTSPACGSGSRSVPDIALNASPHSAQNYYFNGSLQGVAGTSIASPMMSGFVAQANAYLLAIGLGGSPLGELDYDLYYEGNNAGGPYASPHYPYYDVLSGCNSNDITAAYGLSAYCAGTGYDLTTGWGSFNALQLSWAINSYWLGAFVPPTVTFSGPFSGNGSDHWYTTDQTVSWTVTSNAASGLTPTGVAGFTATWDNYISDPSSEATPGSGNSFYSGPEFPNATSGSLDLAAAGQGCHFATVDAWDNAGYTSGDQFYFYICYDNVAPVSTASLTGTVYSGSVYDTAVKVTLSATDATSGVSHTYYSIDGGAYATYSSAFTITALGNHNVRYYSTDVAGNIETVKTASFTISSPTSTALTSSLNPSTYGQSVTFKATVSASLSGTPTGVVKFLVNGSAVATQTLVGGQASYSISSLLVGTSTISAHYYGNVDFLPSVSAGLSQVVNKAATSTALTSSVNPSVFGQSTTLTATITPAFGGTPTGTVKFMHFGTVLGTGTVSGGMASLSTSNFPGVGTWGIHAVYSGDSNCLTSTSGTLNQTVNKASTTTALTSSVNPSVFGQSTTLTATITPAFGGTPTGTVKFMHFGTVLGTGTVSGGKASLSTSNFPGVGTWSIHAVYSGDSSFLTSTSGTLTQTVNKASTSTALGSSANPATHGTSVTFTATVTAATGPTPTGSVTFKDGGTTLGTGTLSSGGVATFSTSSLAVGTHTITAQYTGSSLDQTSTSATLSEVIN